MLTKVHENLWLDLDYVVSVIIDSDDSWEIHCSTRSAEVFTIHGDESTVADVRNVMEVQLLEYQKEQEECNKRREKYNTDELCESIESAMEKAQARLDELRKTALDQPTEKAPF